MDTTIIGVYDEFSHGYSAKNELIASGFSRRQVLLNPDRDLSEATGKPLPGKDDGWVSGGIGNFLRAMFGIGDNKITHSNVFAEAVRRGAYVLTVDVESDEQRVRAEEIMKHYGPVDIEERSEEWMRHGWRGHDPTMSLGGGKIREFTGEKQPPNQK